MQVLKQLAGGLSKAALHLNTAQESETPTELSLLYLMLDARLTLCNGNMTGLKQVSLCECTRFLLVEHSQQEPGQAAHLGSAEASNAFPHLVNLVACLWGRGAVQGQHACLHVVQELHINAHLVLQAHTQL